MPQISIDIRDRIAVVTMTPPELYMNAETVTELLDATKRLERDGEVRVVVLTGGNEDYFIRHYDVRELEAVSKALRKHGAIDPLKAQLDDRDMDVLLRRLSHMPKPVIAAINGNAMGGGFELALACDFRLAQAGDYHLGQPEVNIGILPGAGGTQRLVRLIGTARALELTLTGRTVGPAEALSLGMVHAVADGPVMDLAMDWARMLAAKPPKAVAHIKHLVRVAQEKPLHQALIEERTLFRDLLVSDEALALMEEMNRDDRPIQEMSAP